MADYSLADVGALMKDNDGWGNNGGMWIFALLLLVILGGGNGIFGARDGFGQFATASSQSEILIGQQFQNLDNKIDRIGNGIADATFALNNSITNAQSVLGGAINSEGRALQSQLAECCCTTQRAIDGVNLNMQNQTQKILDAITTNRMADMQNQINSLELQNALCGVVRYPNAWTYNAGISPFCGGTTCGCGSTI